MPIQVSKLSTGIVQGLTVPFQKWLVNAVNQINTGASQNDVQNVTSQGTSGTFVSSDGFTVTVTNGIITGIE
jgi:hypothetical protein